VLHVKVPPRGPLWFDEASPDLGFPWALAGGVCFPYGHNVLVVAGDGARLLDPSDPGPEG
jgi:hypothetical protein